MPPVHVYSQFIKSKRTSTIYQKRTPVSIESTFHHTKATKSYKKSSRKQSKRPVALLLSDILQNKNYFSKNVCQLYCAILIRTNEKNFKKTLKLKKNLVPLKSLKTSITFTLKLYTFIPFIYIRFRI